MLLTYSFEIGVEEYKNTDATAAIVRQPYKFLNKSHKTLLMLRRTSVAKNQAPSEKTVLELRHQRTGDVVFDWVDETNPFKKPSYYVYKLIETLLPKAMAKLPTKKNQKGDTWNQTTKDEHRRLKMVELWAPDDSARKGWLKVVSLR